MAIGYAFATGLFKGYNDLARERTAKELAASKAESELNNSVIQTILGGVAKGDIELSAEALSNIKGMGINEDAMALLQSVQSNMESANDILYGNYRVKRPDDWDKYVFSSNSLVAGRKWLSFHEDLFSNPATREPLLAELNSNQDARDKFLNDFNRYQDLFTDGSVAANRNPKTGEVVNHLRPEIAYSLLFKVVDGIYKGEIKDNSNEIIIKKAEEAGDIENPQHTVVFSFTRPDGKSLEQTTEFNEKTWNSLTNIASSLNLNSVQELADNFKDVTRAETAEEAYDVLYAAAELEQLQAADFNRSAGVSKPKKEAIGSYLKEKFGEDRILMAQAMATLMVLESDNIPRKSRRVIKRESVAVYFKRYLDIDVAQLREQYNETQETRKLLTQLYDALADEVTPTGLVAAATQQGFGILGQSGQLDQIWGDADAETKRQLRETAIKSGFFNSKSIDNLSKIDALKLTLAAKMARAIDPSGRLSNQDFEIQLQRLGVSGLFSSKKQAKTKLQVVRDDFDARASRMQLLYEIASKPGEFGIREERLLKADRNIQMALDAAYQAGKAIDDTKPPSGGEGLSWSQVEISKGTDQPLYQAQDSEGNTIYSTDPEGKNIISEGEAGDIMDKVTQSILGISS